MTLLVEYYYTGFYTTAKYYKCLETSPIDGTTLDYTLARDSSVGMDDFCVMPDTVTVG